MVHLVRDCTYPAKVICLGQWSLGQRLSDRLSVHFTLLPLEETGFIHTDLPMTLCMLLVPTGSLNTYVFCVCVFYT